MSDLSKHKKEPANLKINQLKLFNPIEIKKDNKRIFKQLYINNLDN